MTEQREPTRPDGWGEMSAEEKALWFDEHPIEQEGAELTESLERLAPVGARRELRNQGKTGIRRLYPL